MQISDEMIEAFGKKFWPVNSASKIDAYRDELRDALHECLKLALGWRPINTAPKDGTLIILHDAVRVASGVGRWRHVSSRDTLNDIDGVAQFSREYGWRSASDKSIDDATHWMPIPDAPSEKAGA